MPIRNESMIERVVRVLEAFESDVPLSATELARRTDIPVPTTHRIVADLLRLGLLERDDQRLLRVGYRLWELATRSSSALSIRDIALPFMEELHSVVRQHTQLSILDGHDVLIVEKLTSRRSSGTNVAPPGSRLPALACAPGLVLAAFGESSARENLLIGGRLTKFTDATVLDRDELRQLLAEARRKGFAAAPGWIHSDAAGLAAPVLGRNGRAVAALSVTGPLKLADDLAVIPALITTARMISRAIGSGKNTEDARAAILKRRIRNALNSERQRGSVPPEAGGKA